MPDNTPQNGTVTIATDEVATLNGAASTGVHVQRLKVGFGDDGTHRDASATFPLPITDAFDNGRTISNLFMALPILTTAADVLMSLTGFKGTAAVAATTTPAVVAAGKRLRIFDIHATYLSVAAGGGCRFSLRANPAGVAAVGSPIVMSWFVGGPTSATAGLWANVNLPFPNGLEFAAGTGLGLTIVGINATGALAAVGYGTCTINGIEY